MRSRLCRFVPGMSWDESGRLSWLEWSTLVDEMNEVIQAGSGSGSTQ